MYLYSRSKLNSWTYFWKRNSMTFLIRSTLWPKSQWKLTQMCFSRLTCNILPDAWALNSIKYRPVSSHRDVTGPTVWFTLVRYLEISLQYSQFRSLMCTANTSKYCTWHAPFNTKAITSPARHSCFSSAWDANMSGSAGHSLTVTKAQIDGQSRYSLRLQETCRDNTTTRCVLQAATFQNIGNGRLSGNTKT